MMGRWRARMMGMRISEVRMRMRIGWWTVRGMGRSAGGYVRRNF